MDIIMLKNFSGSTDGYTIQNFLQNERYNNVPESLAKVFISVGAAKLVEIEVEVKAVKEKVKK
jgi:hypothetical protein